MDTKYIKHIDHKAALSLAEQVAYRPGQIVSMTLAQNKAVSMTLFAFDKGEEISTHASHGDALVMALDGEGEITIGDKSQILKAGESIVMPAGIPHAVKATDQFKMFLIVVFPQE